MKKKYLACFFLALVAALVACNDPVFYYISVEPPISEPLIGGSPTNFVVFDDLMYVASGNKVFRYTNLEPPGKKWEDLTPGGRIMQLAATDNYLYALCHEDGKASYLRRYSSGGWEDVTGDTGGFDMLQSVYAGDKTVFIGAQNKTNGSYSILFISDDSNDTDKYNPLLSLTNPTGMLCGIAFDSTDYYLCTKAIPVKENDSTVYVSTIFIVNRSTTTIVSSKEMPKVSFTGIINLDITNGSNKIVAISRDGKLYDVSSADITEIPDISFGDNRPSTGALAVWVDKDDSSKRLLLAGRQDRLDYYIDSGYTYGYLELELDAAASYGIKDDRNFEEPGFPKKDPPGNNTLSSVEKYDLYVSTIGKNPVNHIFQAPDMTLFASTQKNGVWSYRDRGDGEIWNTEVE